MKKIIMTSLLAISLISLSGCGKKSEIINAELSLAISENVEFSEQLTQLDNACAERRYMINSKDYDEITAFVGTNGTSDEYVIVKTNSPKSMVKKLTDYAENKYGEYSQYRSDEAEKLKSPLIEEYKDAVVFIVTADKANAQIVYEEYLKK